MPKIERRQLSKRIYYLFFVLIAAAAVTFITRTSAQIEQTVKTGDQSNDPANEAITVRAADQGNRRVNYADGKQLTPVSGAQISQSQPNNLISADFDSDGIADLVTADDGGVLRFYQGNIDSIYQNTADAQARQMNGSFSAQPFTLTGKNINLAFAPDYLETGDFNADGFKDVLAAANGGSFLELLAGDGHGNFTAEKQITVDGKITALKTGEIGRADGQTDLAVAVINKTGNYLVVFEHPQGAFAHEPEIFKLSAPANALAIGNLDDDFYGDIAAGGGSVLTVVQGRGQAFPWDLNEDLNIKRPEANVLRRVLPFSITDLTIGKFTDDRADSLAMLSDNGSIYTLESVKTAAKTTSFNAQKKPKTEKSGIFMPTGGSRSFAKLANSHLLSEETAQDFGLSKVDTTLSAEDQEKQIRQNTERSLTSFGKMSKEETAKTSGAQRQKAAESKELSKKRFVQSLAAKPANLAVWNLQTLVSDARIAGAAHSSARGKLKTLRVSGSNKDDLILLDTFGKQIELIVQPSETETQTSGKSASGFQTQKPEIVSFASEGSPLAVLPMRLNADALDDLVVLQSGAAMPSIVKTATAQVLTVNTTDDGGASNCFNGGICNLRDALNLANNLQNATINFNIAGGGVQTISPVAELPTLTHTVTIDATTQPGYAGTPLIEIDGGNLSGAFDGIKIRANNCVVRGLAVNRFPHVRDETTGSYFGGNGISIETTSGQVNNQGNIIEGNFLGIAPDGVTDKGNASAGLIIFSADHNTIGGTGAFARNVISGNGESLQNQGIGIESIGDNNLFENNLIGTNAAGTAALPNSSGVLLSGANNQIGADGAGNVISGNGNSDPNVQGRCLGNGFDESLIYSADDPDTNLTLNNTLKGNKIGTNAAGTGALGNCGAGITTNPQAQLIIGSVAANGRNIISGNGNTAIDIEAIFYGGSGGFTGISGDNIGTDISGTKAIANDTRNGCSGNCFYFGVVTLRLDPNAFVNVGAPNDAPSSSCTGFCTLVSGNRSDVFSIGSVLHSGNTGTVGVFNSFVGTDAGGTSALPNSNGIYSFSGTTYAGLSGFGTNVISGNTGAAVFFQAGYGYDNFVQNNLIGTDVSGHNAVPNNSDVGNAQPQTVYVSGDTSANVYVGGTDAAQRNVISGNRGGGIRTFGQNVIQNNYVGVDMSGEALPNSGDGIDASVEDAGVTFIGGTNANQANVIRHNGGVGVDVFSYSTNYPGAVEIRGNTISDNGGIGIDLSGDGVTANDCDDSDAGPNGLQNYPELDAPTYQNGSFKVHGTFISSIRENYTLDFYASNQVDSSNYGEGQNYIGSLNVQTNLNGFAAFDFTPAIAVGSNQIITATATDNSGETSEFSCGAGLCGQNLTNEVRAASGVSCASPIIVNTTTDDADADTGDGVCDTDVNTADLQCSLRAAIQEANHRGGAYIAFQIPGGGVQTISPSSALPTVLAKSTIDATTQNGYNGSPLVELKGANAGSPADGLDLAADKIIVRGFAVNSFSRLGIFMHDASSMTIESCYIGTDATGNVLHGNGGGGIGIYSSSKNIVGGANSISQNVINGNADAGIFIALNSPNNTVTGNRIGITVDDSNTSQRGVQPIGIVIASSNNTIGGAVSTVGTAPGNIISGNYLYGVEIGGDQTIAAGNVVAGNLIGTNGGGNSGYGNDLGVYIFNNSNGNTIGGNSPKMRNIISGNTSAGVEIKGGGTAQPMNNIVQGNYIGTDVSGNAQLAGGSATQANGVVALDAHDTVIGGAAANTRNVISGNDSVGVVIQNSDPNNELTYNISVSNNYIGVGQDGSTPVFNKMAGVFLSQKVHDNNIGGNGTGNVISGNLNPNGGIGIGLNFDSHNNQILGNYIGTNAAGNAPVPNFIGISITGANTNYIGGIFAGARNIVSGNSSGGIVLSGSNSSSIDIGASDGNAVQSAESVNELFGRISKFVPVETDLSNLKNAETQSAKNAANSVSTGYNFILGNYIGTDLNGTAAISNSPYGVGIFDGAAFNFVGVADNGARNVISGNTDTGIFIGESGLIKTGPATAPPLNNAIAGNYIGTDKTGNSALPNTDKGVWVYGAENTEIGSADEAFHNVISGNGGTGIVLRSFATAQTNIENNYIGVSSTGSNPVPNRFDGIAIIDYVRKTTIRNNVISGNFRNGIEESSFGLPPDTVTNSKNAVQDIDYQTTLTGNLIGLSVNDSKQTVSLGNGLSGIELDCARQVLIGRVNYLQNIISANHEAGIKIIGNLRMRPGSSAAQTGCESQQNTIQNSIIGTDAGGAANLGNGAGGIVIANSSNNIIGAAGAGNVISGNQGSGITLQGDTANVIYANSIGVVPNADGYVPLGNSGSGIDLQGSSNDQIGGTDPALRNIISANAQNGIVLDKISTYLKIKNNAIGKVFDNLGNLHETSNAMSAQTDFGNGANGILIENQSNQNVIGGTESGAGNIIADNGGSGVRLDPTAGAGNLIDPNSIFDNGGLGIDLGNPGITPNDSHDADSGANNLQNFPEISSAVINGGSLSIKYKLDSSPANSNYGASGVYVEFFKADATLSGQTFLGSDYYQTSDYNAGAPGLRTITFGGANTPGISAGDKIVATATDADGNTSEFTGANVGIVTLMPTAAAVSISGKVLAGGRGLANARVELTKTDGTKRSVLTNSFGNFSLTEVSSGATYVIGVSAKRCTFAPQIVSVTDNISGLIFNEQP